MSEEARLRLVEGRLSRVWKVEGMGRDSQVGPGTWPLQGMEATIQYSRRSLVRSLRSASVFLYQRGPLHLGHCDTWGTFVPILQIPTPPLLTTFSAP